MQEMDEGESPYTVVTSKVMRNNLITNLYLNTHQLLLHEPKARRTMHVSSYVNGGVSNVLTYADLLLFQLYNAAIFSNRSGLYQISMESRHSLY